MGGGNGFHPLGGRLSRHFDSRSRSASPYLSYHDILLTLEDIHTLKDDWLTDNVIAFWEEYMEREELPKYKGSKIVLLRPSMSFLLMETRDPTTLREALPDFTRVSHVFLPINDCHNPSLAEGGSHWSLLLISIVDGMAFHYDSLNSANKSEAHKVTRQMSILLGRQLNFIDLEDSPQQENGSDCGVFVCLNMRHLLMKRLLKVQQGQKVSMSMGGRTVDASRGRKEILSIIEARRKEGEKRRSQSLSPLPPKRDGSKSPRKSISPPRIGDP